MKIIFYFSKYLKSGYSFISKNYDVAKKNIYPTIYLYFYLSYYQLSTNREENY